jgi:hypothetical protein
MSELYEDSISDCKVKIFFVPCYFFIQLWKDFYTFNINLDKKVCIDFLFLFIKNWLQIFDSYSKNMI